MSEFVRVCSVSDLPSAGKVQEFTAEGRSLCVANFEGTICVLDGTCPHEGGPLGEGSMEAGKVVCPWHAYAFDLQTGGNDDDPNLRAEVLEARVENAELCVRF